MKNLILLALLLTLLGSCVKNKEVKDYRSIKYNIYLGGKLAGFHQSSIDDNGFYSYVFEYSDRGRGPQLEEKIKLNADGVIEELQITGVNYLKDKVNEVFSISNNIASWKSTSENDSTTTDGKSFYIGTNSILGDKELLLRKLLSAPDHSVNLLPSGTAKITDIQKVEINDTLTLNLLELSGLSFIPSYTWLDEENRIFASVSSNMSFIREGHRELIDKLLDIQNPVKKEFFKKLAQEYTKTPEGSILIKNVNLFDSQTGTILNNRSVVVNGNKIERILSGEDPVSDASVVIDGTNKTLLPGLFDNHCHVGRTDGILHLAAGVTSIRDMANSNDLPEIRDEFNSNASIGPRIVVMAGFIDQAGPFAGPGKTITNLEEGIEAIAFYKERGYHQIKLYSSIDPEWVEPMAKNAHEQGMRLSGHIPAYMLAEQALKDGYDEIQHVNMLVLNFLSDTIDSRTPLRFSAVAEYAHELDLDSDEFKNFITLLKEKKTVLDPTVSIFEGMFTSKPGEPDPQFAAILDRLPIQVSRKYYSAGLPITDKLEAQYKASFKKLLEIINELYLNGITIVPGTDAMAGFALHRELENYVEAGIPPAQVLRMATIISAQVTSTEDQLGSIEEGKLADLILVDGNPVENISDIRRVELTIKDGNMYTPADLYRSIGVKHFE